MTKGRKRFLFALGVMFILSGVLQLHLTVRATQNPSPLKLVPDFFRFLIGVPWSVGNCVLGVVGGFGLLLRWRPGWIMAILFCVTTLFSQTVTIGAKFVGAVEGGFPWLHTLIITAIWIGMLSFLISSPVKQWFNARNGGESGSREVLTPSPHTTGHTGP